MSPASAHPAAHWLGLAVLVAVWGSSFAMTKIAVETISPAYVVALRMWVSIAVIAPLLLIRGEKMQGGWRIWLWYILLGAIGNIIPFMLITWGTKYIASGLAGILMGMVPLVVVSLAHFFVPGERLTPKKSLGFLIGFSGVIVLIGPAALLDISRSGTALLAQIAILGATLCYAAHTISARLMPPVSTYQKTFGVLLAAAIISVPVALVLSPQGLVGASALSLSMTVLLGIFPTAIAGLILFWLITEAGPSFVSVSNYLIPAFALTLGVIWLGEHLSLRMLAGFALILSGVWISQMRRRGITAQSS